MTPVVSNTSWPPRTAASAQMNRAVCGTGGPDDSRPVNLVKPLGVGGIGPQETGGADARLAVERIDDKAGILRDYQQFRVVDRVRGCIAVMHGFQTGILGER